MSRAPTQRTPLGEPDSEQATGEARSYRSLIWRRFRAHRMAVVSAIILGILLVGCYVGPFLSPYDTYEIAWDRKLLPPSLPHPLGTDDMGRDELTRILAGGRISLFIGLLATVVSSLVGCAVGVTAGFYGEPVDSLLMRLTDVLISFPQIMLVMLFASLFGKGLISIALVIGALGWMYTARVVRASCLSLKQQEFVMAAHCVGAGNRQIMLRHILPNAMGPVIVAATVGVANAIIMESALSYLGLGVQVPVASWGSMLRMAQNQLTTATWLSFFPGLMIVLAVLAINFMGDGLRDALDPYQMGG